MSRPVQPTYKGVMRSGTHSMGPVPPDVTVADFVKSKFRAGWRRLSVTIPGGSHGIELGGIGRVEGKHVWWGEKR